MDDSGEITWFNVVVACYFFALEFVLRSSTTKVVPSLTTTMLLLSSILANVVSHAGLGSNPAFKIPPYDFHSLVGNTRPNFLFFRIAQYPPSSLLPLVGGLDCIFYKQIENLGHHDVCYYCPCIVGRFYLKTNGYELDVIII
jgi:hypothetical protein